MCISEFCFVITQDLPPEGYVAVRSPVGKSVSYPCMILVHEGGNIQTHLHKVKVVRSMPGQVDKNAYRRCFSLYLNPSPRNLYLVYRAHFLAMDISQSPLLGAARQQVGVEVLN